MPRARIELHISADEFLRLYQGSASVVVAECEDGTTLQFPAQHLRRFVSHDGIHGRFEIDYDAGRKLRAIHRLS